MKQVFVIDDQVMDGLTREEVEATAEVMREVGCFRLPYDEVTIRISFPVLLRLRKIPAASDYRPDLVCEASLGTPFPRPGPSGEWVNRKHDVPGFANWDWSITLLCPGHPPDPLKLPGDIHNLLGTALIVVLASKGIIKEELKLTGLQRLRRQKLEDGVTTTHIYLDPKLSVARDGAHASPRMHLRRGHTRNQHYGPGMALVKKIFIEPTWVCSDADFMVTRTAYTVH